MAKHKEKFSEKYLFSLTELEIGAASAVTLRMLWLECL